VALSGGNLEYETVLPTWQWINELLIGKQFNKQKKTRAIVLARPETVAYYNVQNPVVNVSSQSFFNYSNDFGSMALKKKKLLPPLQILEVF
jgi:hypothetical protein